MNDLIETYRAAMYGAVIFAAWALDKIVEWIKERNRRVR